MVYGPQVRSHQRVHLRRSRHPHELLRLLRRREGRCQVPVGRGAAPLLARREGRSPEHRDGGAAIWAMAGHSKDAEKGAAAFLNYLLKPEVQARFHQLTGYVPVTLKATS